MSSTIAPVASSLSVRELSGESDHQAWNEFVGASPEGDVLQAWEWGQVKSPEWAPIRLGVFRGGTLCGGIAALKRTVPLIGAYLYASRGPLLADWNDSETLRALLDALHDRARREGAAFLRLDPAIPIEREDVVQRLQSLGFSPAAGGDAQGFGGLQPRCVMQLDLEGRTLDEVRAAFKGQARRNIKLAIEKHGVEVQSETTRDDIATFHELYRVTAARDGFRPYTLSYLQKLWDVLAPAGMVKMFLTRYQGQFLSGAICFRIGDKAWYVFGASSNEHRNVMPNYAMQWAMIAWAKSLGCRWYDFRGVSPRRRQEGEAAADLEKEDHLQGLNRFKEGFSPRYVEYIGEWDYVYNKVAYWAHVTGKPGAQKIVRRLKGK